MTPLKPTLRHFIYAFFAALVATTAQAEAPNMPDDPQTTRVSLRERKGRPLNIVGLNSVDGFMRQILKVDPELKTFANLPKGSDWKQADVFVVFVDDVEKISTLPKFLSGAWEWDSPIMPDSVNKYVEFSTASGDPKAVMFVLPARYDNAPKSEIACKSAISLWHSVQAIAKDKDYRSLIATCEN